MSNFQVVCKLCLAIISRYIYTYRQRHFLWAEPLIFLTHSRKMGVQPFLPAKVSVTIDTMLNFDGHWMVTLRVNRSSVLQPKYSGMTHFLFRINMMAILLPKNRGRHKCVLSASHWDRLNRQPVYEFKCTESFCILVRCDQSQLWCLFTWSGEMDDQSSTLASIRVRKIHNMC